MKLLLFLALMCQALPGLKAQKANDMENNPQDVAAIRYAIEHFYFDGIYTGDIDLLRNVYYPGTLLFGDVKGEPYFKTLDEYFTGVKNRQSPKDSGKPFKGNILSLNVVNSIAVAKLTVRMYDFNYTDFLSFHKIDGKWVIVNKMMSDVKVLK